MQVEEQIHSDSPPVIAPGAQSEQSKPKRGGKRSGGRKPNLAKVLLKGVSRNTILAAVENVDVGSIIRHAHILVCSRLLRSKPMLWLAHDAVKDEM